MKYKEIEFPDLKFHYLIYENGKVLNIDKDKEIKPYKDKRRINKPPIIYLKNKDGSRVFVYLDELVSLSFMDNYDDQSYILHLDGDIDNCQLNNLVLKNPIQYIRDITHDNKEWRLIKLPEINLFYNYYISEDGVIFNGSTFSFVKPFLDKRNKEMQRVNLYIDKKEFIHMSISRLVAMHFIPNHPNDKNIVYFKDGNCSNTHYSNLSWGDRYDVINNSFMLNPEKMNEINFILGKEKWKLLKIGLELYYEYEISNYGRVYNKTHKFILTQSRGATNPNNQSWMFVNLRLKSGEFKKFLIHRLVALHFVKNSNPEIKNQVNHINGNPEYNWSINLEWCTPFENLNHAIETNLLHTQKFNGRIDDCDWRLRTIISWSMSMTNQDLLKSYGLYKEYVSTYEKNITRLTFEEFKEFIENASHNDSDFIKIYNFYNNKLE